MRRGLPSSLASAGTKFLTNAFWIKTSLDLPQAPLVFFLRGLLHLVRARLAISTYHVAEMVHAMSFSSGDG